MSLEHVFVWAPLPIASHDSYVCGPYVVTLRALFFIGHLYLNGIWQILYVNLDTLMTHVILRLEYIYSICGRSIL